MCKCYICDNTIDAERIQLNEDDGKVEPCAVCMAIINDTIDLYGKREDDIPEFTVLGED